MLASEYADPGGTVEHGRRKHRSRNRGPERQPVGEESLVPHRVIPLRRLHGLQLSSL